MIFQSSLSISTGMGGGGCVASTFPGKLPSQGCEECHRAEEMYLGPAAATRQHIYLPMYTRPFYSTGHKPGPAGSSLGGGRSTAASPRPFKQAVVL